MNSLRPAGSRSGSFAARRTSNAEAHGGFTLLEVLVAVAVLALAMAAIISGGSNYARNAAYLREKTLALWVAHNRMTEIALSPTFPSTGKSDDEVDLGGIRWTWHAEIKETQDKHLRRIDISVNKKADERVAGPKPASYASLSGFISDKK